MYQLLEGNHPPCTAMVLVPDLLVRELSQVVDAVDAHGGGGRRVTNAAAPPAGMAFQPRPGRAVAAAGWIPRHSQNACYSKVGFTPSHFPLTYPQQKQGLDLIKPIFLRGLHVG